MKIVTNFNQNGQAIYSSSKVVEIRLKMKVGDILTRKFDDTIVRCPLCGETGINYMSCTYACGFSGSCYDLSGCDLPPDLVRVLKPCNSYGEYGVSLSKDAPTIEKTERKCDCDSWMMMWKGCQCGGS